MSVGNLKGSRDVAVQDQFTEIIDLHMTRLIDTAVLRSALAIDDRVAEITVVTTPVVGDMISLKDVDGVAFYQGEIIAVTPVAGDDYDVDLDIPLDFPYSIADEITLRSPDMNVNGSVIPIVFSVSPVGLMAGTEWDITRMIYAVNGSGAMDDGLFGDQPALFRGIVFRSSDGITKTIFNAKNNGDFAEHGYDREYSSKAPAGQTSVLVRRTFAGQSKNGVVVRIRADAGDGFACIIQDNLSLLVKARGVAQGHIVELGALL